MKEKEILDELPYAMRDEVTVVRVERGDTPEELAVILKWQDTKFRLKYGRRNRLGDEKGFSLYLRNDSLHEYNPVFWEDNRREEQYNHNFYKQFFIDKLTYNAVRRIEKHKLLAYNPKRTRQLEFEDVWGLFVDIYISRLGKHNRKRHKIHHKPDNGGGWRQKYYWSPDWKRVFEWKLLDDLPLYNLAHQPVAIEVEPAYESIDEKRLRKSTGDIMSALFNEPAPEIDAEPEEGQVVSRKVASRRPAPEYIKNNKTTERPDADCGIPYFFRNIPMPLIERVSKLPPKVWKNLNQRRLLTNPYIFPKEDEPRDYDTGADMFVLHAKSEGWNDKPKLAYDYWNYVLMLANMCDKKWKKVEKYNLLQYRTNEMMKMLNLPDKILEKIDAASELRPRYARPWQQTRIAPNNVMPKNIKTEDAKEKDELFFQSSKTDVSEDFIERYKAEVKTAMLVLEVHGVGLPLELSSETLKKYYRDFAKANHPDYFHHEQEPRFRELLELRDSGDSSIQLETELAEIDKNIKEAFAATEKKYKEVSIALGNIRKVVGIVR